MVLSKGKIVIQNLFKRKFQINFLMKHLHKCESNMYILGILIGAKTLPSKLLH